MHTGTASVTVATLLLLAVPAAADPPSTAPVWKVNQRREALVREGEALVGQRRWGEARERFVQAIAIRAHPKTLLWMGYCEEQLGHPVRARAVYEQARDDARAGKLEVEEKAATEALATLEPKIPRLTLHVPPDVDVKASVSPDRPPCR
jgi:hypothetical protein